MENVKDVAAGHASRAAMERDAALIAKDLGEGLGASEIRERRGFSRSAFYRRMRHIAKGALGDNAPDFRAAAYLRHEARTMRFQRAAESRLDGLQRVMDRLEKSEDSKDLRAIAPLMNAYLKALGFVDASQEKLMRLAKQLRFLSRDAAKKRDENRAQLEQRMSEKRVHIEKDEKKKRRRRAFQEAVKRGECDPVELNEQQTDSFIAECKRWGLDPVKFAGKSAGKNGENVPRSSANPNAKFEDAMPEETTQATENTDAKTTGAAEKNEKSVPQSSANPDAKFEETGPEKKAQDKPGQGVAANAPSPSAESGKCGTPGPAKPRKPVSFGCIGDVCPP
jgi:hypothetical protein